MDGKLVERDTVLETVLVNCRQRKGTLLAGPAGVGKSRILREVLHRLAPAGWWSERFVATESTRPIPFGAMISLIPQGASDDRAQLLAGMRAALLDRADSRPLVVAIDDAHQLDEASMACISDLIHREDAVVLLTVRTDDEMPAALTSFWSSGAVDRVAVEPLTETATVELAVDILGGRLDAPLAEVLTSSTGGNPLLVRELLLDAQGSSAIVRSGDTWRQRGPLHPGPRLQELVSARVGRLDPDEGHLLELVAVGEPLSTSVLDAAEGSLLDVLEQRGLARVESSEGDMMVRTDHPLVGETIRRGLPTRRRIEIARDLARRLIDDGCRRPGDALRAVGWWRDACETPPPTTLAARAAQEALSTLDLDLAADLASEVLAAEEHCEALITLGETRRLQGRAQDAEDALAQAAGIAPDEEVLARITRLRSFVQIHQLERAEAGIELLEAVAEQLTDTALAFELRQSAFYFSGMFGRYPDVLRTTEDMLTHDQIDEETRWSALMNRVYAQVMLGRLEGVDDALADCLTEADARAEPVETTDLLWALQAGTFTQRGELVDGGRIVTQYLQMRRSDGHAWGTTATILTQLLLFRASPDVFRMLDDTRRELAAVDPFGVLPIALGVAACALAQAGRIDEAIAALELVPDDQRGARSDPFVGRGRAAVLAAGGDVDRAAELAMDSGLDALGTTHVAFGVLALHDAARYGRADLVADAMAEAVCDPGARLLRTMADDAMARRNGDGRAVANAGDAFAEMGAPLLASDALAHAAGLYPLDSVDARRTAVRAALLARGAAPFVVRAADETPQPLSDRELDVAALAALGTNNRDIAKQLFISVRTVENHLHQTYRKLEVAGGRVELADLLARGVSDRNGEVDGLSEGQDAPSAISPGFHTT